MNRSTLQHLKLTALDYIDRLKVSPCCTRKVGIHAPDHEVLHATYVRFTSKRFLPVNAQDATSTRIERRVTISERPNDCRAASRSYIAFFITAHVKLQDDGDWLFASSPL